VRIIPLAQSLHFLRQIMLDREGLGLRVVNPR
jgi:hypothetical protein